MVSVSSAFNQDMPSQSMANSSPADSYYAVSVQKDIPANVATLNSWRNIDESSSDDEDEVLWTGNEFDSDDDFILVPHVSATAKLSSTAHYDEVTRDVVQGIGHLSFSQSDGECTSAATEPQNKAVQTKVSKGGRSRGNRLSEKPPKPPFSSIAPSRAVTAPAQQSEQANTGTKKFRRKRSGRKRLAAKKTVEKVKESGSSSAAYQGTTHADRLKPRGAERRFGSPLLAELDTEVNSFAQYEGAASFITSFLKTSDTSQHTRLTFLQSLIIELGLMSSGSTLPSSLNAATRFLKANAFLNIRDYLSVRHEGFEKLQQIRFKSRKELANDLRKNRGSRQVDRTWVKEHGLSVFLVRM